MTSEDVTAARTRWLDALRSGQYAQGRSALRITSQTAGNTYCCLGVLCDLLDPQGWGGKSSFHRGNLMYPEQSILDEVGLTQTDAAFLGECNDDSGMSFIQIADLLQWYWENDGQPHQLRKSVDEGRVFDDLD